MKGITLYRSRLLGLIGLLALGASLLALDPTARAADRAAPASNRIAEPVLRPDGREGRPYPTLGARRPPIDLRRDLPAEGRLAGPFSSPPQAFNMTTFPRPPETGAPTAARDLHPNWSVDDRSIVFASNRTNRDGTATGPRFSVWLASSDGATLTQLTGTGAEANRDQLYPALSPEMGRVAFAGQPAAGAPLQLYVLDLLTGARSQLTGPGAGLGLGAELIDVTRSSWSPGGDRIAFSARRQGTEGTEVYLIEVGSRAVVPLTRGGSGINSLDPAWSPDGRWIAFASTGKAVDASGVFTQGSGDHDLWLAAPSPPGPGRPTIRVTQGPADDREPAWSPNVADDALRRGTGGRPLLAFASNRAGTYDIWWLAGLDPNGAPTPESDTTNPVRLLLTNDVNPADGMPRGRSNERYPTWSRIQSSDYVAYQTDATGNGDIWQASLLDRIAPALEAVDEAAGEIVRVTPRLATPGTPVKIEARVRDLQSGVESVWVQFKDPDGRFQGTADGEHKLYRAVRRPLGDGAVEIYEEWDAEGVSAMSAGQAPIYFRRGRPGMPSPSYLAVWDDRAAFSGSEFPPLDGSDERRPAHWLRLWDDGPAPDGHEPPGGVAGDGIFSAEWTTPLDGSDYYLDVIVYDRATDPLGRFPGRGNWKLYDNVGGFSTVPFVARQNVLAVMDHTLGQKILGARLVFSARGAPSLQLSYPALGTESEILDRDARFLPKVVVMVEDEETGEQKEELRPIPGAINNLGPSSILGDAYDVWRILARGPIDAGTLFSYAPVIDRQPDPSQPLVTRPKLVAERAVLWAAPFAGNIWAGSGSITDPQTQALLTQFVERGGRLWVSGQDVAWALTANGQSANSFLNNILRTQYVADVPPPDWFNPLLGGFRIIADIPEHPIVRDPLEDRGGFYSPAAPQLMPDPLLPVDLDSYSFLGTNDALRPAEGGVSVYSYAGAEDAPRVGRSALIAQGAPSITRQTIFCSFGLEQVGRHYVGEGENVIALNYRGKLTHAALCWMTHFAIQGRVTDTSRQPLAGVVVRVIADPLQGPVGTALTAADGTYLIRGLPPRPGGYTIEASLRGFLFQHEQVGSQHGLGRRVTRDLVMTRVAR